VTAWVIQYLQVTTVRI